MHRPVELFCLLFSMFRCANGDVAQFLIHLGERVPQPRLLPSSVATLNGTSIQVKQWSISVCQCRAIRPDSRLPAPSVVAAPVCWNLVVWFHCCSVRSTSSSGNLATNAKIVPAKHFCHLCKECVDEVCVTRRCKKKLEVGSLDRGNGRISVQLTNRRIKRLPQENDQP